MDDDGMPPFDPRMLEGMIEKMLAAMPDEAIVAMVDTYRKELERRGKNVVFIVEEKPKELAKKKVKKK